MNEIHHNAIFFFILSLLPFSSFVFCVFLLRLSPNSYIIFSSSPPLSLSLSQLALRNPQPQDSNHMAHLIDAHLLVHGLLARSFFAVQALDLRVVEAVSEGHVERSGLVGCRQRGGGLSGEGGEVDGHAETGGDEVGDG